MLAKLFARPRPRIDTAAVDAETVVYAVGDIHGSVTRLDLLHRRIAADARVRTARRRVLVHLGDYIDRGGDSKAVLDRLVNSPMPGFEVVNLLGNHDAWLLRFLADPADGPAWLANGGEATLLSYGVAPDPALDPANRMEALRAKLDARIPGAHKAALARMQFYHMEGDYLFVHAGIRPGRALREQTADDLLWIRDGFLESAQDHGVVVVHGHSIVDTPEVHVNRIAIDTGAYATGNLTAVVLQGRERSFLNTA